MMPFEPNKNHLDTMYAGALYTLGELPGGAVLMASFDLVEYFPTLGTSTIKYIKPVESDIFVELNISEEEIQRIREESTKNGKSNF